MITGATSASYTSPAVALSDNGSTFQVTVTNISSSATSDVAILTAGPRAPMLGDLRYLLWQQVTIPWNSGGETGNLGATEESITNALGTPLQLGSSLVANGGCEWHFSVLFLPPPMTGLDMSYQQDFTQSESYVSYLQSVAATNVVINSIDLEPACGSMGVSWVKSSNVGGFDYRLEAVPPAQIQAAAAADGAQGRIITAATFDDAAGNAILISYGWQGDVSTIYEAKSVIAMPPDVANQATQLASEGYFISAFGGNDTDGYVLVGMRVKGDALPRPISGSGAASSENVPFTVVAWLAETAGVTTLYEQ